MSSRAKSRAGGFTLIEILLAVVVFGIAMVGILPMLVTALRASTSAVEGGSALSLASTFVEELKTRQIAWRGSAAVETMCELHLGGEHDQWKLPLTGSCSSGTFASWADAVPRDAEGNRLGSVGARKAIFCLHYRTTLIPDDPAEVLATVRVAYTADGSESWPDCQVATVDAAIDANTARAIVLPAVIGRQP